MKIVDVIKKQKNYSSKLTIKDIYTQIRGYAVFYKGHMCISKFEHRLYIKIHTMFSKISIVAVCAW